MGLPTLSTSFSSGHRFACQERQQPSPCLPAQLLTTAVLVVAKGQQKEILNCQLSSRAAELCTERRILAGFPLLPATSFPALRKTHSRTALSSKSGGGFLSWQLRLEKQQAETHWATSCRVARDSKLCRSHRGLSGLWLQATKPELRLQGTILPAEKIQQQRSALFPACQESQPCLAGELLPPSAGSSAFYSEFTEWGQASDPGAAQCSHSGSPVRATPTA